MVGRKYSLLIHYSSSNRLDIPVLDPSLKHHEKSDNLHIMTTQRLHTALADLHSHRQSPILPLPSPSPTSCPSRFVLFTKPSTTDPPSSLRFLLCLGKTLPAYPPLPTMTAELLLLLHLLSLRPLPLLHFLPLLLLFLLLLLMSRTKPKHYLLAHGSRARVRTAGSAVAGFGAGEYGGSG